MSEQSEWEEARRREYAAGENRPARDKSGKRSAASVKLLRSHDRRHARLDVLCRNRLIARVLDDPTRGLVVVLEAMPAESGFGFNMFTLDGDHIVVLCRCALGEHLLDPNLLGAEARPQRGGSVKTVGVAAVSLVP